MPANLFATLSFVFITTFTPGPNNLTSASMGVAHGYRSTLRYLAGMTAGVFGVMVISGWVSATLLRYLPAIEPALRIVGAGYILYLAFSILKANYTFDQSEARPMGFAQGLALQLLNPKLIVYSLTLFSTFLAPISGSAALLGLVAALLAAIAFSAASTWALFGTGIKLYLHQPRLKAVVNIALGLLLVYTAVELAGLL
jgi:cysteine/O-acetylserine efflux protein